MSRYDVYLRALREGSTTAPYAAWLSERVGAWLRESGHVKPEPVTIKLGKYSTDAMTTSEWRRGVLASHGDDFDHWLPLNP